MSDRETIRTFSGRAVIPGEISATAVVTRQGFNTLASFQKSAMAKKSEMICSDQNNPDLFGKNLTGRALCLPQTIGSTTGGMVLQTVADMGAAPAALLFSQSIDSLAAAGVILSAVWNDRRIVTVDRLGEEFLAFVEDGMRITVKEDGTVMVERDPVGDK